MTQNFEILSKPGVEEREDFKEAVDIANRLRNHINEPEIVKKVFDTHKLHAKSGEIQDIFLAKALELGFVNEKKAMFRDYTLSQLRPDYFRKLNENFGIIMEVERGKTLANNMDLLDVWKCHICPVANYLFLVVPKIRQSEKGNSKVFPAVVRRMRTFFTENTFINVDAVFVFGY